jgi:hypothetical protein
LSLTEGLALIEIGSYHKFLYEKTSIGLRFELYKFQGFVGLNMLSDSGLGLVESGGNFLSDTKKYKTFFHGVVDKSR